MFLIAVVHLLAHCRGPRQRLPSAARAERFEGGDEVSHLGSMPGRTLIESRRQTGEFGGGDARAEESLKAALGLHALCVDPRQSETAPHRREIEENTDRRDGVDPVSEGHDVDQPWNVLGGEGWPPALEELSRDAVEGEPGVVERVLIAPQKVG